MIHPTAVIDTRAEIAADAEIGPYVVIDGPVRVGARTRVQSHVTLLGFTEIGPDNVIHTGAVLGDTPQDLAFAPTAKSYLRIGARNVFRELVQVNRGTAAGSATVIGDDNYLMAHSHVGHNCRLGNRVILANGVMLGGYVEVGDAAFLSGNCAVHQYCRVGRLSMMRGLTKAARDVPPFCIVDGTHTVRAVNRVGMRRAGIDAKQIRAVYRAVRTLFVAHDNLRRGIAELEAEGCTEEVRELIDFIRTSKRGVARGSRRHASVSAEGNDQE